MLLSEDNHIHQQGKKQKHFLPDQYFGGDNGARTRDLLTASQQAVKRQFLFANDH